MKKPSDKEAVSLFQMTQWVGDAKADVMWENDSDLRDALLFIEDALDARAGELLRELVKGHCHREARREILGL